MMITEEEYEALMEIREKAYEYSEKMDSEFIASIADRLNDIVLGIDSTIGKITIVEGEIVIPGQNVISTTCEAGHFSMEFMDACDNQMAAKQISKFVGEASIDNCQVKGSSNIKFKNTEVIE